MKEFIGAYPSAENAYKFSLKDLQTRLLILRRA